MKLTDAQKKKLANFKKFAAKKVAEAVAKPAVGKALTSKVQPKIPRSVYGKRSNFVCMKFNAWENMDTGASPTTGYLTGQKSYRLNNVNLPFVGQSINYLLPQGFDQAAAVYKYFKVYAAKIKVVFHDPNDDLSCAIMTSASGDSSDLQNQLTNITSIRSNVGLKELSNTGSRKATFSWYVKMHQIEGLKPSQYDNDITSYKMLFQSSAATAATDEAGTTGDLVKKLVPKLHIAISSPDGTQRTCKARIDIDYYCRLSNKKTLSTSLSAA